MGRPNGGHKAALLGRSMRHSIPAGNRTLVKLDRSTLCNCLYYEEISQWQACCAFVCDWLMSTCNAGLANTMFLHGNTATVARMMQEGRGPDARDGWLYVNFDDSTSGDRKRW